MSVVFPGISAVSAETKSSPKGTAIPLTPTNGWTNYSTGGTGYSPLTLYSFSNGLKMLIGMVRAGTKNAKTSIATVPTEHRPKYQIVSMATCGNSEVVRVDVNAAGQVLLMSSTGTGGYNIGWVNINVVWMDKTLDV